MTGFVSTSFSKMMTPSSSPLSLCVLLVAIRWAAAQDPAPNVIDALAGLKTQLNTVNSTADLTCESSRMMVNLTFAQPFFGKVFAENNPADQACWLLGTGLKSYQYPVPLKLCGTRQISLREFENTLQIRFGNTEAIMLADERKTILCRYPPPVVPPILPIVPPIVGAIPPVPAASVSELELLLIIAAVLFLGLLLLGLCCAWWCCKRRRAAAEKIVESEGILIEAPDIMKLSGETIPFHIPRASPPESESALINRLEGAGAGSGSDEFRIPRAATSTQQQRGYELQQASMIVPESIAPSEFAEGDQETQETVEERDVEHTAIFGPPIPVRPPSPPLQRLVPPPAPFGREDYERETVSDLTETEVEHTLIAGRVPQRPPSELFDMRSVSEVGSEESITRRSVVPMPPPVRPPPPLKSVTTEMETETHSVVESLENELILRAVPKRQPKRLMPPPEPVYPVDTRTETTVTSERQERVYPLPSEPVTTMRDDRHNRVDERKRPPLPPATTTTTVTETNISRDIEVYPPSKRPPTYPPSTTSNREDRREWERNPPPEMTTTTVTETNISRDMEVYPPKRTPTYPPSTTSTREDRREYERYPPSQPSRGPQTTTTRTTRETDIHRDYDVHPPPTTTTTRETDIQSTYEVFPDQPRYPGNRPPRPLSPTSTTQTTRESDVRREYEVYPEQPRYPGEVPDRRPVRPLSPTTTTRTTRETNIQRNIEVYPGGPLVRAPSPTLTTYTTREADVRREYEMYPGPNRYPGEQPADRPPNRTTTRITRETDVRRDYELYPGPNQPLDITTLSRTGDYDQSPERPFSPEFVNSTQTVTERNVRRDFEVYPPGPRYQPPYSSTSDSTFRQAGRGPYGPSVPDTSTTRTHRETNIRRDYDYRDAPPRDGSISPDYPDTTNRMTEFRDFDYPSRTKPTTDTYVTTTTRDIQKSIDVGTPPEGSGPPSETSPDDGPTATRTVTRAGLTRDYPGDRPRQPNATTTTTATTTRQQTTSYVEAVPTYQPFSQLPSTSTAPLTSAAPRQPTRAPVEWDDVYSAIYDTRRSSTSTRSVPFTHVLPQDDIDRLRELVIYDRDFQLCITRVRTVYDLYYIRYTPPYDTYFVETTWTVIIRIFVIVLDLPHPHPDDPDFIEPQPEWFSRPMSFGSRDRSDTGSSSGGATLTNNSYAERALSEVTEDVPRMQHRTASERSEESDGGSSYFGSVARRGSGEYSASERSVAEYFEDVPTVTTSTRTYREQRRTRVGPTLREGEEPTSEL